jgi:3-hydroxybutyryl-CoA dehydratase
MLSAILISAVAGMKMPGQGSIYLNQTLSFKKPVFMDDTVTATCIVKSIRESKRIVTMETNITNQNGELVIAGDALVLAPEHTINPAGSSSGDPAL